MTNVLTKNNDYAIIKSSYDKRPIVIMTPKAKLSNVARELDERSYKGRVIIDFTLCIGMKPQRFVNTYFNMDSVGFYRLTHYAEVSRSTRNELCVYIMENYLMNHSNLNLLQSNNIKTYRQNPAKFIDDYINK